MSWYNEHTKRHGPLTTAVLDGGVASSVSDNRPRTFLHVDMDAFFASVEIRDNPSLAEKPVAVGGSHGNKGIIVAANYIARQFGLHAGMSGMEAHRLCPRAIFLPTNGRKYVYASARIMAALEEICPDVTPLSIDEASLDLTGCLRYYGSAIEAGRRLKLLIHERFLLPCTVGIGPNRLVAKMAANLGKPDGLLELKAENVASVFAPLPVDKMVGIGAATKNALHSVGIHTLGQLAKAPEKMAKSMFGILGPSLQKMALGEYSGRMRQDEARGPVEKSIGHSRTYGLITDPGVMKCRLVALAEMVARRSRRGGWIGRVLTLSIRYTDFETITHQSVLPYPTDEEEILIDSAWKLFDEAWERGRNVRLLGLSLGRLIRKEIEGRQQDLFARRDMSRLDRMYSALDILNDRFGEGVVSRGMGERWKGTDSRHPMREQIFSEPLRRQVREGIISV